MPIYDDARAEAAYAELDALTSTYRTAERRLEAAKAALVEAIVRHLRANTAPVLEIALHTPYSRGHVTRLARRVPAAPRGRDAGPTPDSSPADSGVGPPES